MPKKPRWIAIAWNVFRGVVFHPSLWRIAVLTTLRFGANGWWKRPPFLPLPGEAYWRFRMETAYADPDAIPSPQDAQDFLRWCNAN